MENASKALIIAGTMLISVLIISMAVYIYNTSQSSVKNTVSQLSQQEIDSFNNQWLMYEGQQMGSKVRTLISKLIANATQNAENETKLPSLYSQPKETDEMFADSYASGYLNELNIHRTSIDTKHIYGVHIVLSKKTGLVSGIIISYNPKDDLTATYHYEILEER